MSQRIIQRLYGDEYIARAERLRKAHQRREYTDEFTSVAVLVEVDGELCVRALTAEERKSRALATLNRVPKCCRGKRR